jgi:hypothetical protein
MKANTQQKEGSYCIQFSSVGLDGYFNRKLDELFYSNNSDDWKNIHQCKKFIAKTLFNALSSKLDEFLKENHLSIGYKYDPKYFPMTRELTLIIFFDPEYYENEYAWSIESYVYDQVFKIREELVKHTPNTFWGYDKLSKVF